VEVVAEVVAEVVTYLGAAAAETKLGGAAGTKGKGGYFNR
jgi:hypothetical protein